MFTSPLESRPLALLLTAAWVLYLAGLFTGNFTGQWADDLAALYVAGLMIARGQEALVYVHAAGFFGGTPPEWQAVAQELGAGARNAFPYLYPPIWAEAVAPLTKHLSAQQFFNLFGLVHAALLGGSLWLAAAIARPKAMPIVVFIALDVAGGYYGAPVQVAALFNQPSVITGFFILLAFERALKGRSNAAGAALAVATAIKLTPLIFILLFLWQRDWRALRSFALVGGALGLLCLALSPALSMQFLGLLALVGEHSTLARVNTSVLAGLYAAGALLGLLPSLPAGQNALLLGPEVAPFPVVLSLATKLGGALALWASYRALRHGSRELQLKGGLLTLSLILPLFGPLGWLHYYVVPMLLLPMLAPALPTRAGLALFAALVAANAPETIFWVPILQQNIAAFVLVMVLVWLLALAIVLWALARLAGPEQRA